MADGKLRIEFEGDLSQLRSELKKVLGEAESTGERGGKGLGKGFSQGFKDAFSAFTAANLAMRGIDAGLAMVNKGLENMLAKEDALADFSAITGVTGLELAKFGEAATALSNKFGTSAIENIEAFKGVLSRLGPDFASSTQAVQMMGDTINTLAIAAGLTAEQSMDALTTAMLQFGVDLSDPVKAAEEAARMMNEMAAGAKEGAAEIPQIAEAIKQVGSTAASLGVSSLEVNAFIQTLAMGGKTGSEAGIALRNVLTSLIRETGPSAEALGEMGLSAQDLGKILTSGPGGANNAIKTLKDGLERLPGPAERNAALVKIFGVENLAAAQTLVTMTAKTDDFNRSLKDTNTGFDQTKIKLDTTQARWQRFSAFMDNSVVGALENIKGRIADVTGGFANMFSGGNVLESLQDIFDPAAARANNAIRQKRQADKEKKEKARQDRERKEAEKKAQEEQKRLFGEKTKTEGKQVATLDDLRKKKDELERSRGKLKATDNAGADKLNRDIDVLQKKIDRLEGKKSKGGSKKESPIAGTFLAMEADIKKIEDEMAKFEPGSDVFVRAQMKVADLKDELASLREATALVSLDDVQALGLVAPVLTLEERLQNLRDIPQIDMSDKVVGIEALGEGLSGLGLSLQSFGDAFTMAFEGGEDSMKTMLQAIANSVIDFLEAEYVAAGAAVAIRALLTGGFSLAWDTSGFLAAGLALEAARGAINSLDVGGMLKTDQLIQAHADETVIPYDNIPDIWARVIEKTGGSAAPSKFRQTYRAPEQQPMNGTMKISYQSLGAGMRDAQIHASRRSG